MPERNAYLHIESASTASMTEALAFEPLVSMSTSLLTIFALAATSKLVILSLPVILVLDAIEEYRDGELMCLMTFNLPPFSSKSNISAIIQCNGNNKRLCAKSGQQKLKITGALSNSCYHPSRCYAFTDAVSFESINIPCIHHSSMCLFKLAPPQV
jgi:hypothetical protein